jgi:hypothetical protein
VALLSTTIVRLASCEIPSLIVTPHCCYTVRRDGNWIRIRVRQMKCLALAGPAPGPGVRALSGFTVSPAPQSGDAGRGPGGEPQAFPKALRVPIELSLHPDELQISLVRERALEPIQKLSDASGGSLVAGTPSPCRTEFLVCRQTLLTSTRKGCCSILAINKTSHCFCSATSKV